VSKKYLGTHHSLFYFKKFAALIFGGQLKRPATPLE
jgi:hypothetical protein